MHSRKTRPKLPILDGIMDAVSRALPICRHKKLFDVKKGKCKK